MKIMTSRQKINSAVDAGLLIPTEQNRAGVLSNLDLDLEKPLWLNAAIDNAVTTLSSLWDEYFVLLVKYFLISIVLLVVE